MGVGADTDGGGAKFRADTTVAGEKKTADVVRVGVKVGAVGAAKGSGPKFRVETAVVAAVAAGRDDGNKVS